MVSDTDSSHPVDILLSLVVLGSSVQWFIIDYRAESIGVSSSWEERLCDTGRSRRQLVGMDRKRNIDQCHQGSSLQSVPIPEGCSLEARGIARRTLRGRVLLPPMVSTLLVLCERVGMVSTNKLVSPRFLDISLPPVHRCTESCNSVPLNAIIEYCAEFLQMNNSPKIDFENQFFFCFVLHGVRRPQSEGKKKPRRYGNGKGKRRLC